MVIGTIYFYYLYIFAYLFVSLSAAGVRKAAAILTD
jgi:hypothetical protein